MSENPDHPSPSDPDQLKAFIDRVTNRNEQPADASTPGGRGSSRQRHSRRVLMWSAVGAVPVLLIAAVVIFCVVVFHRAALPATVQGLNRQPSVLTFSDGTPFSELTSPSTVQLDAADIPSTVRVSVVAAADPSFDSESGPSTWQVVTDSARALVGGAAALDDSVTDRLIALSYPPGRGSIRAELEKVALTVKLNQPDQKDSVVAHYLSDAAFGPYASGLEQAAQVYFGVKPADLSPAQAAVLGALVGQGEGFDSADNNTLNDLFNRYLSALDALKKSDLITQAEYSAATQSLPAFTGSAVPTSQTGPRGLVGQMVTRELLGKGISIEQIRSGQLTITTTLDSATQTTLEQQAAKAVAAATGTRSTDQGGVEVGAASINAKTGDVLAIYGGANDTPPQSRNWAVTPVPAGASFYPYTVLTSVQNGLSLDSPVNGSTFTPEGSDQPVSNPSGQDLGTIDLKTAWAQNADTGMVDAISQVPNGLAALTTVATSLGVSAGDNWSQVGVRLAAGAGDVTVAQTATAYTAFAAGGALPTTHVVVEVRDATGSVIYEAARKPPTQVAVEQAVTATVAAMQDATPQAVKEALPGNQVAMRAGVARADGRTQSAWAVGVTPNVSTAVMMTTASGNLDDFAGAGQAPFDAGGAPTALWTLLTQAADASMPADAFPTGSASPTAVPSATLTSPAPTRSTQAPRPSVPPVELTPNRSTAAPSTTTPPRPTTTPVSTPSPTAPSDGPTPIVSEEAPSSDTGEDQASGAE